MRNKTADASVDEDVSAQFTIARLGMTERGLRIPSARNVEGWHRSTLLVHYATMSHRVGGEKLEINQEDGTLLGNPNAAKFWKREYRSPYVVPEEV